MAYQILTWCHSHHWMRIRSSSVSSLARLRIILAGFPGNDCVGQNVSCHNGSGPNHSPDPHLDSGQNDRTMSYPDMMSG